MIAIDNEVFTALAKLGNFFLIPNTLKTLKVYGKQMSLNLWENFKN